MRALQLLVDGAVTLAVYGAVAWLSRPLLRWARRKGEALAARRADRPSAPPPGAP